MRTYLVRIPHRKGHSIQSDVLAGFDHCWPQAAASTVRHELAQTGGISSCHTATPIEQPGRSLLRHVSSLFLFRDDILFLTTTMPLTWAEDRALLRSNPSAVPGANTEWGGTMPPSAIRDWHQSDKSLSLPSSVRLPSYHTIAPCFRTRRREGPALGIGLPLAQHVPDDRGQLAHHGDAGDGRSPAALDALEPLPQPGVLAQHLVRHLRQQPPGHAAAGLGDVSQPLRCSRRCCGNRA